MTDPIPRDVDRQAVYDAEDAAFGGTTMDEALSWDEVEVLVDAVTSSPWYASLDVPAPSVVPARRGARRSSADGTCIRLSEAGRDAATVVHEIAHHVDHHLGPGSRPPRPAHGPEFRAVALRVAELVGGTLARDQLARAFRHRRLAVATWPGPEPRVSAARALRGAIPLPAAPQSFDGRGFAPRVHTPPPSDVGCG